ncbi:metallophosphoesterase family protein [Paenibacillus sp. KQZ6P-2]|uniref:Metallophosphoesterase family protein n=1 Tax=Paenibacillus mangrovi TaxID=2931978 RepID=A0A9X2B1Q2_9BACL|nr:metallophosphoesterase [Paenibacillus mangrovi]MCJ8011115.1 metallophosphoesterase family protein [Paenibacillus mangrovi]
MVTGALYIWIIGIIAAGCVLIFARMSYEARLHDVTRSEVMLERLPEAFNGSRIFFISDIHKRKLSEEYLQAYQNKADLVILGGDIMEKNVPLKRVKANLEILSKIGPMYAVYGNHDLKADPAGLARLLREVGGTLLRNENVLLERSGEHVCLTGVDQPLSKRDGYPQLPELGGSDSSSVCRIVVVHDPAWLRYVSAKPADLILAGHTHGGQIRLPFFGAIRLSAFYRKYDCGWFKWYQPQALVKRPQMLISRGFGNRRVTLRLCCPAEMHLIQLKKAPEEC